VLPVEGSSRVTRSRPVTPSASGVAVTPAGSREVEVEVEVEAPAADGCAAVEGANATSSILLGEAVVGGVEGATAEHRGDAERGGGFHRKG
jgi:hypothetical protein